MNLKKDESLVRYAIVGLETERTRIEALISSLREELTGVSENGGSG